MIYSEKLLEDNFVLDIYIDILELSPMNYMEYAEQCLQEDIYFILLANIPKEVYKEKIMYFPIRRNH
jgi:hypothetical protein